MSAGDVVDLVQSIALLGLGIGLYSVSRTIGLILRVMESSARRTEDQDRT